jgi:hypothetical protein
MENNENKISHNFTLDSFAKAEKKMIATNDNTYGKQTSSYWSRRELFRDYSAEDICQTIITGSISEQ